MIKKRRMLLSSALINKILFLFVISSFFLTINNAEINNNDLKLNNSNNNDDLSQTSLTFFTSTRKSGSRKNGHKKTQHHRISHRNSHKNKMLESNSVNNHETANTNYKNLTVKVGESIILNCAIDSSYGLNPGVIWMQGKLGNVLTLNTNRITVDPRFEIIQQPTQDQTPNTLTIKRDNNLNENKQNEMSYFNLRINSVQAYDENEYACETSLTKKNDDQPNLHSLIYLHVTQSPSFVENLTSESNMAANEFEHASLKCFAVGKPAPKVKWYRVMDGSGLLEDLQYESNTLILRNLSRHDSNKYECVASNGILPSVSKKFSITINFEPILTPIKPTVHHQVDIQTIVIGCSILSNPESIVSWYLLNANGSYDLIVELSNKYQIHKFKQSNQTVSYLKIKNAGSSDFTKYKCMAANLVGKNEIIIEAKMHHKKSKNFKHKNNNKQIVVHNQIESSKSKLALTDDYYDQTAGSEDSLFYENDSSETNDDEYSKPPYNKLNKNKNQSLTKKKKINMDQFNTNNQNKTYLKYKINNSNNKLIERDNDDEKLEDSVNINQGSKLKLKILDLLLSSLLAFLCFNK